MPRSTLVVAVVLALLTGCATAPESVPTAAPSPSVTPTPTPTPTPEPTGPPPLSELVATADGLGPLVIGLQPPVTGVTDIAFFDAACVHGYEDALVTGAWRAAYPNIVTTWEQEVSDAPFRISVDEAGVERIDIKSSEIRTPEGISVGSTRDQVLAAYPDVDEVVVKNSTEIYGVRGDRGWLMIEVSRGDYYYPTDTVIALRVDGFERGVYGTAFSDNVISTCIDGE